MTRRKSSHEIEPPFARPVSIGVIVDGVEQFMSLYPGDRISITIGPSHSSVVCTYEQSTYRECASFPLKRVLDVSLF